MTAAKFNCTVPGTLPSNTSLCSQRINKMTTISLTNITSPPLTSSMATVTERDNNNQSLFQIGSQPLLYIVIVITGGVISILSCVIGASLVLCVRRGRECTRKYNLIFILKCRIFLIINNHNIIIN